MDRKEAALGGLGDPLCDSVLERCREGIISNDLQLIQMDEGNANKDLGRESSIDVAIVHGVLAIKENRREYGRAADTQQGLLEFLACWLKINILLENVSELCACGNSF